MCVGTGIMGSKVAQGVVVSEQQLASPYRVMVVNLSVVAKPQERKLLNA